MEIQKNERINALIDHFGKKFGSNNFLIKDFWYSDQEAIGISNLSESRLIYISAFDGQTDYFVSLEEGKINSSEYTPVVEYNDVDSDELDLIFAKHLDLTI
jgi:hypothetical protein